MNYPLLKLAVSAIAALMVVFPNCILAREQLVALTFDDLPSATRFAAGQSMRTVDEAIAKRLRHAHVSAIGFVNGGAIEMPPALQLRQLRTWLRAGMELGNHTYSHLSANDVAAGDYVNDIAKVETFLRPLLLRSRRKLRWFRHPYLETGDTLEKKERIDTWLSEHGYRTAPVTIDSDDWLYAALYDDAIERRDEVGRRAVRAAYLDHLLKVVSWTRLASQSLFERDIPQVILLHDTRLEADCVADVIEVLRHNDFKPAPLTEVLRDPAYSTPDPYLGKDGEDWLERWSQQLGKELPWDTYPNVPQEIRDQVDALGPVNVRNGTTANTK